MRRLPCVLAVVVAVVAAAGSLVASAADQMTPRLYVPAVLVQYGGGQAAPTASPTAAPVPTAQPAPPFTAIAVAVDLQYQPYVRETVAQQNAAACVESADHMYALENAVVSFFWERPVVQGGLVHRETTALPLAYTGADCWTSPVTIDLRNELIHEDNFIYRHVVWATATWRDMTATSLKQDFRYVR